MALFPHTLLLQTTSQTELENWITAIHSACAAAVARHHHKEDTLRLLKSEIRKLEQKVDMDEKMKKMGEMQLSSVTDAKKKKTILDQVTVPLCVEPADSLGLHFFFFSASESLEIFPHHGSSSPSPRLLNSLW